MSFSIETIDNAKASFRTWLDHDPWIPQDEKEKNKISQIVFSKIEGGYFGREHIKQALLQYVPISLASRITRAVQRVFEHRGISLLFHSISPEGYLGKNLLEKTRKEIEICFAKLCAGDIRRRDFRRTVAGLVPNSFKIESEVKKIFDEPYIDANQEQDLLISVFADTVHKARQSHMRGQDAIELYRSFPPLPPSTQGPSTVFEFSTHDPLSAALDFVSRGHKPCVITALDAALNGGQVEKGGSGIEEEFFRRTNASMIVNPANNPHLKQKIDACSRMVGPEVMLGLAGFYADDICLFKKGLKEDYTCCQPIHMSGIFASPKPFNHPPSVRTTLQEIEYHTAKNAIRDVLRIAALKGHKNIILPAFGCENQGHNPALIARFFGEIFNEDEFKKRFQTVCFALPPCKGETTHFEAFSEDCSLRQLAGLPAQEKRKTSPSDELPLPAKRNKQIKEEQSAPQTTHPQSSYNVIKVNVEPFIQKEAPDPKLSNRVVLSASIVSQHEKQTFFSPTTQRETQNLAGCPIDLHREKLDVSAQVVSIKYDSNYHRFIAFVRYKDGEERHIFAPEGLKEGDEIISSDTSPKLSTGSTTRLKYIPVGASIHCIEMIPGGGAKLAISSGMGGKILSKEGHGVWIEMPSGKQFLLNDLCRATIGIVRK